MFTRSLNHSVNHYNLKLTSLSQAVLFGGRKIRLVHPDTIKERQKLQEEKRKQKSGKAVSVSVEDELLFDKLRHVRRKIANGMGKPPYVVFSNASLIDMTAIKPTTMEAFMEVHGVGEHKARRYGRQFIEAVRAYEEMRGL